jgi:hypothetical protein
MYTTLFRAATEAILLLQAAQRETEELYIVTDEPVIAVLDAGGSTDGNLVC